MKLNKKTISLITAFLLFIASFLLEKYQGDLPFDLNNLNLIENNSDLYQVTRVIDGDTIRVEKDGQEFIVRYIGMDTPEFEDNKENCQAKIAKKANQEIIANKPVRLEKDISETDKFNRLLRYVWVDKMMINDYLVKNGYAQAVSYPPDIKYQDQFLESQRDAKVNNKGFWDKGLCQDD